MVAMKGSKAAALHDRLRHPVVDADGHMLEVGPVLNDFIKQAGGSGIAEKMARQNQPEHWQGLFDHSAAAGWERMTPKERRDTGTMTGFWWFLPSNPYYRATSHLPRL